MLLSTNPYLYLNFRSLNFKIPQTSDFMILLASTEIYAKCCMKKQLY